MATAASAIWANERRRATTTCRQPLDTVAITRSRSTVVKAVHGSYYSPRGLSSQLLEILILCRGIRARSLSPRPLFPGLQTRSSSSRLIHEPHLLSPSLRLQLATPSVAGPIRSSLFCFAVLLCCPPSSHASLRAPAAATASTQTQLPIVPPSPIHTAATAECSSSTPPDPRPPPSPSLHPQQPPWQRLAHSPPTSTVTS